MAAAAGREPSIESAADATREPEPTPDAEAVATSEREPRPVAEPAATGGPEQPTRETRAAAASDPQVNASFVEPAPSRGGQSREQEASLPVLSIAGSVIAGRLRDPRALGAALGAVAIVAFALGRRGR